MSLSLVITVPNGKSIKLYAIGFRVMSSFVQAVISQNDLELVGRVEKWITLNELFNRAVANGGGGA